MIGSLLIAAGSIMSIIGVICIIAGLNGISSPTYNVREATTIVYFGVVSFVPGLIILGLGGVIEKLDRRKEDE